MFIFWFKFHWWSLIRFYLTMNQNPYLYMNITSYCWNIISMLRPGNQYALANCVTHLETWSAVITLAIFSKILTTNTYSSSIRAGQGSSFVSLNSIIHLHSGPVIAVLYAIYCYIGWCYNSNWLYKYSTGTAFQMMPQSLFDEFLCYTIIMDQLSFWLFLQPIPYRHCLN